MLLAAEIKALRLPLPEVEPEEELEEELESSLSEEEVEPSTGT